MSRRRNSLYHNVASNESHYTSNDNISRKSMKNGFLESLETIKDYGYYWGPITAMKAQELLRDQPDGTFILRDSSDLSFIFAVTFKHVDKIYHVHLQHYKGAFAFGLSPGEFSTITKVIEKTMKMSRNGNFSYLTVSGRRVPLNLTKPLSRFQKVQSLKHISRYHVIKNLVRIDCINRLEGLVPTTVLEYLRDKNYLYDENRYGIDI